MLHFLTVLRNLYYLQDQWNQSCHQIICQEQDSTGSSSTSWQGQYTFAHQRRIWFSLSRIQCFPCKFQLSAWNNYCNPAAHAHLAGSGHQCLSVLGRQMLKFHGVKGQIWSLVDIVSPSHFLYWSNFICCSKNNFI